MWVDGIGPWGPFTWFPWRMSCSFSVENLGAALGFFDVASLWGPEPSKSLNSLVLWAGTELLRGTNGLNRISLKGILDFLTSNISAPNAWTGLNLFEMSRELPTLLIWGKEWYKEFDGVCPAQPFLYLMWGSLLVSDQLTLLFFTSHPSFHHFEHVTPAPDMKA